MLKSSVAKVKNNPIGFVAGAGLTFWGVKKYTSVTKMWQIALIAVVGGVAGAYVQGMVTAKAGSKKSANEAK